MRTTVTLDADVEALVRKLMRERRISFKNAVNYAIRAALASEEVRSPFRTRTYDMGEPAVPLDKALRLAGELEDEALIGKLALRK
jgi:hypothetical protein